MSAYVVVVDIDITNNEKFEIYKRLVPSSITKIRGPVYRSGWKG
jgi:hypothetical protein